MVFIFFLLHEPFNEPCSETTVSSYPPVPPGRPLPKWSSPRTTFKIPLDISTTAIVFIFSSIVNNNQKNKTIFQKCW